MKRIAIHQPLLFPWLGLLHKWASADLFVIHDDCQFKYKEWQNRFAVLCEGRRKVLTASFKKGDKWKPINEVMLRPTAELARKLGHWYRNAPYQFELRQFVSLLDSDEERPLVAVAWRSMQLLAGMLLVTTPVTWVGSLGLTSGLLRNDKVLAICEAAGATHYLSGTGAKKYNDQSMYDTARIELEYQQFERKPYPQYGAGSFVPGLSAVDAILNIGPEKTARLIHSQVPNGIQ